MYPRKADQADAAAIHALIALFPDTLIQVHLPEIEEFFVIEEDGKILACCALEIYSQRLAEIRSLAVLPDQQGKGLATTLIATCLAEAKKKEIYEVLTITGATSIFEKQGFSSFKNEKFALINVLG